MKFTYFLTFITAILSPLSAQETPGKTTTKVASLSKEQLSAWVNNYYKNPTPESFVTNIKAMSANGFFKSTNSVPAFLGFATGVMEDNPDKVTGWLKSLKELPAQELQYFYTAAKFSAAPDAIKFLEVNKIKTPNLASIKEIKPNSGKNLDLFWGRFFAKGDKESIRFIVNAFTHFEHAGELEAFKKKREDQAKQGNDLKPTKAEMKVIMLDVTFQAATWSLLSNSKNHSRCLEHCEAIFQEEDLPDTLRINLAIMLSKALPDKYEVVLPEIK